MKLETHLHSAGSFCADAGAEVEIAYIREQMQVSVKTSQEEPVAVEAPDTEEST